MPSGGGNRRSGRRAAGRPMADINVTPLVDVMLVLLIVFMVTAPMMTVSIPVDLPKANGRAASGNQQKEPLVVTVDARGSVYLQDTQVEITTLVAKLKSITGVNPDARVFVRGDKGVAYGRVVEVMGTISAGGYSKVALVAELPKPDPSPKARGR